MKEKQWRNLAERYFKKLARVSQIDDNKIHLENKNILNFKLLENDYSFSVLQTNLLKIKHLQYLCS